MRKIIYILYQVLGISYRIIIIFLLYTILNLLSTSSVSASETVYFLHSDHLGSTTLITKNGEVVDKPTYYPYGNERGISNQALVISHQSLVTEKTYTGQISDISDTNLFYYNARYYNPTLAKFTTADPMNDQLNRYAYVANNPISYKDPSGNMLWEGQGEGGGGYILGFAGPGYIGWERPIGYGGNADGNGYYGGPTYHYSYPVVLTEEDQLRAVWTTFILDFLGNPKDLLENTYPSEERLSGFLKALIDFWAPQIPSHTYPRSGNSGLGEDEIEPKNLEDFAGRHYWERDYFGDNSPDSFSKSNSLLERLEEELLSRPKSESTDTVDQLYEKLLLMKLRYEANPPKLGVDGEKLQKDYLDFTNQLYDLLFYARYSEGLPRFYNGLLP